MKSSSSQLRLVRFISFVIFIAISLAFSACDRRDKAWEKVQQGLDEVNKQIGPVTDSVTSVTDKAQTILRYEYKVVRFSSSATAVEIETTLNTIGADRWDCFSVIPGENGTTIYCKRLPYAMLRYLMRVF